MSDELELDQDFIEAMNESEDRDESEFEPLPDGHYLARIESIKKSDRPGASGYHQWVVVWRIERPRAYAKRTQWDRLSLSPRAAWKMRELFDALGFEYTSKAKELVGERAILELFQEEITSGKRKGEIGNSVAKVLPYDDEHSALVGR